MMAFETNSIRLFIEEEKNKDYILVGGKVELLAKKGYSVDKVGLKAL